VFHPIIETWFRGRFGEPTEAQRRGWPEILAGRNTLIAAPTGSGKTLAAFLAGLISFLSPCVLPLVPGYVSLISGAGVEELKVRDSQLMRRVMQQSVLFILGFSVVFITLGALSTEVGRMLARYKSVLAQVAGVIIILFGLHLTGVFKIKALYTDARLHSVKGGSTAWGSFVIGFAFAFGWTPCIGPILATVLALAAASDTIARGVLLLAVYSAGLAIPFLLTALGIGQFMAFYKNFRKYLHAVEVFSGALLLFVGGLVFVNKLTWLSAKLSFLNRFSL
jgi:cytochrome c-type biogenesis protein